MQIKTIRTLFTHLEQLVFATNGEFLRPSFSIKKLVREMRDIKKYMSNLHTEVASEFLTYYEEKTHVLDFILFLHIELFLLLSEKFILDENEEKNLNIDEEAIVKLSYISLMMVHLINSLLSIRILMEKGLDVQAKQIFRSYIEYSDIALAILGNDEFYSNYRQMGDSEEKEQEIWYKFLRPKSMTKILKEIFLDIDENNLDLWKMIENIRGSFYSRLSEYTHGHFMAVFEGAIDKKMDGSIAPNVLGAITEDIDYTLKSSIIYSYSFLKHAIITIVKYQKLPFMHFEEEGKRFIVHYKMLEVYMATFVKSWEENSNSAI